MGDKKNSVKDKPGQKNAVRIPEYLLLLFNQEDNKPASCE